MYFGKEDKCGFSWPFPIPHPHLHVLVNFVSSARVRWESGGWAVCEEGERGGKGEGLPVRQFSRSFYFSLIRTIQEEFYLETFGLKACVWFSVYGDIR